MKKLFPIAMFAVVAMMFTSCKKDYTCTCKTNTSGISYTGSPINYPKTTKSKAKDACSASESNVNAVLGAGAISCSIN